MELIQHKNKWYIKSDTGYREVLATTDKSLWKGYEHDEGMVKGDFTQIPQSFIEEYCKNPVDEIEVEYELDVYAGKPNAKYAYPKLTNNEIIIHKEEKYLVSYEDLHQLLFEDYLIIGSVDDLKKYIKNNFET